MPKHLPNSTQVKLGVAPMLSGLGESNQINQAISYGVPVVATRVAIKGLQMVNGTDVMEGNDPLTLAAQLVLLYTNCKVWQHIVDGGITHITNKFSDLHTREQLLRAMSEAGLPDWQALGHYC